ncbi:MAG: hypothetical protein V7776_23115 [Halopseudomonas aestusnigri]
MTALTIMAAQEAQNQAHMLQQSMRSMAEAEMTHQQALLSTATKGSDKRAEMVVDASISHNASASKVADGVANKL